MDKEPMIGAIEFAAEVVKLSLEGRSTSDTMNGLALATAALLVDLSVTSDGDLDQTNLVEDTKRYLDLIVDAVYFAKNQLLAEKLLLTSV